MKKCPSFRTGGQKLYFLKADVKITRNFVDTVKETVYSHYVWLLMKVLCSSFQRKKVLCIYQCLICFTVDFNEFESFICWWKKQLFGLYFLLYSIKRRSQIVSRFHRIQCYHLPVPPIKLQLFAYRPSLQPINTIKHSLSKAKSSK